MNEVALIVKNFDLKANPFIEKIEDLSNELITRIRILFKNKYQLSIVRGYGTFGAKGGLFEIAPINKQGEMDESLFDEQDQGDCILGYCDIGKVIYYIQKIGTI